MRVFLTDLSHLDKTELARLHESLPTFRKASAAQCKGENYPQHVVSFCLVRYAARQIAPSVDTESWCFAESGKPHLACGTPFFSLSHTKELVAVAVSSDTEIGIDIEAVRPHPAGFVKKYFSEGEQNAVAAAKDPTSELTRIWTVKEAEGKRLGTGLANGVKAICGDNAQSRIILLEGTSYWLSIAPADDFPEIEWIPVDRL